MATFEVKGTNAQGKDVKVYFEADSAKGARTKARQKGIIPLAVKSSEKKATENLAEEKTLKGQLKVSRGVGVAELANMTRQLSTLVKAHVPIVESLSALVEQIQSPKLRPMLMNVRQNVKEGKSLGESFAMFPKIFNRVYINMVKAGESSGRLDVVLARLAEFSESQVKLRNKVSQALTYPVIMMVVGFLVLIAIFAVVIPQILVIFQDMQMELPLATKILIGASAFAQEFGQVLLLGILGLAVLTERFVKTEKGRAAKDRFLLRIPILSDLTVALAVARFSRTLGVLLNSGVPMMSAMKITRNVVNHSVFEKALDQASEDISEGRSLNFSLKQSGLFPPIVLHMVGVGEKTGELEQMLFNVADNYDQEIEFKLGRFTTILEPAMILVMVGFVGFIVMAILQPLLEMQNFQ